MVKQDIFEGLKLAIAKGETLQHAMQSFYNAGYKKQDIEEAARALQMEQAGYSQQPEPVQQQISPKTQTTAQSNEKPKGTLGGFFQKLIPSKQNQQQKQEKDKPEKVAIILLAIVLFVLIAGLVIVLLFKEQIANLFRG
ncbi:MAG: hypothetical protein Q8P15_02835 [Nanoarchaeota archaeon]|nr:hypothetical protein [Nanoarchaeota archaeon]